MIARLLALFRKPAMPRRQREACARLAAMLERNRAEYMRRDVTRRSMAGRRR